MEWEEIGKEFQCYSKLTTDCTNDSFAPVKSLIMSPIWYRVSAADCCAVGLGLNPGEEMDICKCIVPWWHESTLNGRPATSPLEVGKRKRGGDPWTTPRLISSKLGGNRAKRNRPTTCIRSNDRCLS
ncbi:hypothetical protein TNCV_3261411 [Trichonephila clavipes]|nr:hypothetical protein TNCV_3261411 [Trichonephila clavipes]